VVCQLDMLRNCVTLPALRKALSSLPKTLDDTYERILVNIDESYCLDVQKILKFLAFAIRPVGLLEMVEVLAIDWNGDEPRFVPDNRIPEPKDILTMCSTLVTTTEDLGTHFSDDGYQDIWLTIRLAHFSVKEYLLSDRIMTSKASMYALDPVSANLFIAKTYLVYLLSLEFLGGQDMSNYEVVSRSSNWPILRNATLSWPMHIEMVGEGIDDEAKGLIRKLFASRHEPNGGSYAAWVAALIPGASSRTIINTPPLYYAASYSMVSIVKMLLSEMPKSDIDLKGGGAIATPLHVACYRGKAEVVELLLENGADPNSTNCVGQSCLYWARQRGLLERTKIYDLLMKYGAKDKEKQDHLLMGDMTAKDMLEDEHYTNEYYRLAASDLMDGSD
jgi:hypothetical protein